jgi:sec-independent protein translocase protein TatA
MSVGPIQILLILVVVVLLFGRGKISAVMGDVAKGIKSFKKGIQDEPEDASDEAVKTIDHEAEEAVKTAKTNAKSKANS